MPEPRHDSEPTSQPTTAWESIPKVDSPLILERYRILERVGGGGMGNVHKALHTHLNQFVAIKTIRLPEHSDRSSLIERFQREMSVIGLLQHPHIVRATDGGEEAGVYYLVMELIDGVDLSKLVRQLGALRIADACELIRQAALGLAFIHEQGLVHRDIKPSNLLLSRDGIVKVVDLGLARFALHAEGEASLTPEGSVLGTPDFMSPEQARDSRQVDGRADIYSLGCALFCLLTGRAPFSSPRFKTYAAKLLAHQQEPVPRLVDACESLNAPCEDAFHEVELVVQKMLAKNPEERFANAKEVAGALAPLAQGHRLDLLWERLAPSAPVSSSTPIESQSLESTPRSTKTYADRRTWILGAVSLTVAGLLSGAVILLSQSSKPIQKEPTHRKVEEKISLDELPIGETHNLLTHSRPGFCWPAETESQWRRALKRLTFAPGKENSESLLQLGETRSKNYTLKFTLEQVPWKGGIGVLLHGQLPTEVGQSTKLHTLELLPGKKHKGRETWELTRGSITFQKVASGQYRRQNTSRYTSHTLHKLPLDLQLQFVVQDGKLSEIELGGSKLKRLLEVPPPGQFVVNDRPSMFGVIARHECRFTLAQFIRDR